MKDINQTERLFDEIFKESLEHASAQVPPGVWEGISGSMVGGSAVAGAAVKTAIWMKVAVAVVAVSAAAAISYYSFKEESIKVKEVHIDTPIIAPVESKDLIPEDNTNTSNEIIEAPKTKVEKVENPVEAKKQTLNKSFNTKEVNDKQEIFLPEKQIIDANFEFDPLPIIDYQPNTTSDNSKEIEKITQEHSTITEPSEYTYVKDSSYVFIPNTVTPNGDGINDVYEVKVVGEESFEIFIYSADNQMLYRSKNKYQTWNCKLPNGEDAPAGTYYIVVYVKFKDMEVDKKVSKLTIIK